MHLTPQVRREKLAKLLAAEGYKDTTELAEEALLGSRAGTPSICTNEGCDYICDMEPDQEEEWCEKCGKNTIVAALVLAEMI